MNNVIDHRIVTRLPHLKFFSEAADEANILPNLGAARATHFTDQICERIEFLTSRSVQDIGRVGKPGFQTNKELTFLRDSARQFAERFAARHRGKSVPSGMLAVAAKKLSECLRQSVQDIRNARREHADLVLWRETLEAELRAELGAKGIAQFVKDYTASPPPPPVTADEKKFLGQFSPRITEIESDERGE